MAVISSFLFFFVLSANQFSDQAIKFLLITFLTIIEFSIFNKLEIKCEKQWENKKLRIAVWWFFFFWNFARQLFFISFLLWVSFHIPLKLYKNQRKWNNKFCVFLFFSRILLVYCLRCSPYRISHNSHKWDAL